MPSDQPASRSPHPAPVLPGPARNAPATYHVGTLTYTKLGLVSLFFWLLLGDMVFVLMDQLEPSILPVVLKSHGATDTEIAIIVGSITALFNFMIVPVVSYRSDRKRSRWGRRIPYLAWAAPVIALFLCLTPFSPQITAWLLRWPAAAALLRELPLSSPVIFTFGLMVVLFQCFHMVVASIYFYLFRDVVPEVLLGRFLSLFRVFGSLGTFILNYWLLGMATTHTQAIFIGVGCACALGFLLICCFVREGEYPAVTDKAVAAGRFQAGRVFIVESFSAPVYWWTYVARLAIYAMGTVQVFLVFFPLHELGLNLDQVGKLSAWGAFAWLPLAFPLGWLIDRWGPTRTMTVCLAGYVAALAGSFLLVHNAESFFYAALCLGAFMPMLLLCQSMLAQRIFHPLRMGQLSAANAMLQSLVIAVLIGPAVGWWFDTMKDTHFRLSVPWVGVIPMGPYRFGYVALTILAFTSLLGTRAAGRHWRKLGGEQNYAPPPL